VAKHVLTFGGAVLLALLPAAARAQSPATTFDALSGAVGRKVVVTDVAGGKTTGKVVAVDAESITLLVTDWLDQRQQTIARPLVSTIRKTDSVWNGLVIGFGAGLAATEIWTYQLCGPRGFDDECAAIVRGVGWTTFGAGGAAAGALIDKFTTKLLYRKGVDRTVHIRPVLGPNHKGIAVSLSF
jgi:hypothetical protein